MDSFHAGWPLVDALCTAAGGLMAWCLACNVWPHRCQQAALVILSFSPAQQRGTSSQVYGTTGLPSVVEARMGTVDLSNLSRSSAIPQRWTPRHAAPYQFPRNEGIISSHQHACSIMAAPDLTWQICLASRASHPLERCVTST